MRIPNAFRDGPLKAAGFYARWIKSKNHGHLTEQEMREQFDQAMVDFTKMLEINLTEITDKSMLLRDVP